MQDDLFVIGTADDLSAAKYSQKYGDSLGVFFKDGTWCAFVDRIYQSAYDFLLTKPVKEDGCRIIRITRNVPALEKYKKTDAPYKNPETVLVLRNHNKFDEEDLMKEFTYRVNSTVLHETCLHMAGGLTHEINGMEFPKGLDMGIYRDLEKRYKEFGGDFVAAGDSVFVRKFRFLKPKEHKDKIYKLLEELESAGVDVKETQNSHDYLVLFATDDIITGYT